MKTHSNHEILEIEDAFEKLKRAIDALAEKGKKACQTLQEKKTIIESYSTDLDTAYACKDLGAFDLLRKFSELLEFAISNDIQNLSASTEDIPDSNCTNETLECALGSLDHAMSIVNISKGTNTGHSIACQKLAAVTFLIDILRMNPKHDGLEVTLIHLQTLCHESEACSSRVVFLGGADLLMVLFEFSMGNEVRGHCIMCTYGVLPAFPSLYTFDYYLREQ